jgi:hypothetical protein
MRPLCFANESWKALDTVTAATREGGRIGLDLLQLRAPIPNLPDVHCSIQIYSVVGARNWMQEAADMGLPCPYVEIEIALPAYED